MSGILCVGDIHLSDRPPSSCTDTYQDDLFDLLEQTVPIARARNVDAVVWAGDVFHHKAPSRTSHKTVQRAIRLVMAYYPIPVFICPGNHDMQHDRFESLAETQPLGVLLEAGAFLLYGWPDPDLDRDQQVHFDRVNGLLYGVPWLQQWETQDVWHALAGWRDNPRFGQDTPQLVVAHAPLFPPGTESPWESFPAGDWADAMANHGDCFYGHVHERHGIYEVRGVQFANAGAITRGSLHEYELTRPVKVTMWEPRGDTRFEEIELRYKPASEVFRLAEAGEAKDTQQRLDTFLESIGSATLEVTSTESVLAHVDSLDTEPRVRAVIRELLELS